ncbi:MAG: Gfo/Idh/MocA family oxidoreductase [SAR324 cluster bacterium]|uniref:Gfo/Idh/MocA family oxidoreductase n=1 Tax=SAR324 cluster bacterium TaxID=2024889 RepID=A0A7X9FRP1_9DELT|nr:Gfo/Idh/MocA family oxidoreductase [SAR324 cluster bacterium]
MAEQKKKSALIVGYGSIGQRHARILAEMGCKVAIVTSQKIVDKEAFSDIEIAFKKCIPDYVVIANETAKHYETLCKLRDLDFKGLVLVEKPLFSESTQVIANRFERLGVAYNLRFLPLVQKLKTALCGKKINSLSIYCGQHLSKWRPGTDYKKSYSASREKGGGVLRDLSHDIDMALWLCGPWKKATASLGSFSELGIESEDVASLIFETEKCPLVNINLNYLDRVGRRELIAHTNDHSYKVDIVSALFDEDGHITRMPFNRDDSYRAEHEAMLSGDMSTLCDAKEGFEVTRLISVFEEASEKKEWILNSSLI